MMNQKKYNKPLIAIILTATLLCSTFVGVAIGFIPGQSTQTNLADFAVFEGVAANDYYDTRQYSYQINQWANETVPGYNASTNFMGIGPQLNWFNAKKSLRLGMTEFGEFATPYNAGIAYGGTAAQFAQTESWASTGVLPQYWIQGWVFYMNYTRAGGEFRCVEAYALYSDWITNEGGRKVYSWNGLYNPPATLYGGLTAGSLTTNGVQVLYDSARLAVGRTTVTIFDGKFQENVAKITFTVIFNKDTKYAIIYKDVKILLDTKVLDNINDFAFSERYEIDLCRNVNPSNQAYIHWYQNWNDTVYMHPLTGQGKYDVVQAFDPAKQYIFFAAYWPNTTEHSVYSILVPDLPAGYTRVLPSGTAIDDIPTPAAEPNTPWVVAQWRYNNTFWPHLLNFLAKDPNREIRFVEVAGMTDYNNGGTGYAAYKARDYNETTNPINTIDLEVRYLLNNVFNPEDLRTINSNPFQWISIGQSSAATDSAASGALSDLNQAVLQNPMPMFDRNDTLFTWTGWWAKGTIPYGLNLFSSTSTNDPALERARYFETFSNLAKNTGTDPTSYSRTALIDFCFQGYDGQIYYSSPPQPVAGGWSNNLTVHDYWYPSKDPITERWNGALTSMPGYNSIYYHPNGIINVGGEKANSLTRYFNDYGFAITREGSNAFADIDNYSVTGIGGAAPTSNVSLPTLDFFPLSTWASSNTLGYINDYTAFANSGYAVITLARDINGTRGLQVYGWDARDTYWGSLWASQYLGIYVNNRWIPAGTVALVLKISYMTTETEPFSFGPAYFTVTKCLGTITEFGTNRFVDIFGFDANANLRPVAPTWNGLVLPPSTPASLEGGYKVWWNMKLATTSTAKVDFDP
jgi:hypothetical protein